MRAIIASLLVLVGCSGESVHWSDVSYSAPPRPTSISIAAMSPLRGACPASVRATSAGKAILAAWWSIRDDSSGVLLVAQSNDSGKSWNAPVIADSTDQSVRGCARPAPAIAADSTSGYVHVAYFAEPMRGRGIFFAHSMDSGRTFHSPVPIVFGDNPGSVAVASDGDRVAVAYDDPNSVQSAVGIALSKTMGHIFQPGEPISNASERAKQPVAELSGDRIRVWWSDYSDDPRKSATRTAYREGIWK
jgi:DNA-binding beta-propeller fold protein YncE